MQMLVVASICSRNRNVSRCLYSCINTRGILGERGKVSGKTSPKGEIFQVIVYICIAYTVKNIFYCFSTTGQERYRAITSAYYRGALGAIVVYDITSTKSFENIELWIDELRQHTDDKVVLMLVGNKVDLRHLRAVEKETASSYAAENKMHFVETSALNAMNVDVAFESTLRKIYEIVREQESDRNEHENEQATMLNTKMNGESSVRLKEDTNADKGRPSCCS